jgi:hypothetical protein
VNILLRIIEEAPRLIFLPCPKTCFPSSRDKIHFSMISIIGGNNPLPIITT